MGKKHLKPKYKSDWTPERPTTGYCYVVTEVAYHHLAPEEYAPYVMKTGENETHWFLKNQEGDIIDLTADQFNIPLDYSKGKRQNFMTKQISKRGKWLSESLGL